MAGKVARILRASGLPVWRDRNDLPPGDTSERLREALASGISGAVLIVTAEIVNSKAVRDIELPQLLELHKSPDFALQIINNIESPTGNTDFDAPDSLLGRAPGELRGVDQQRASSGGIRAAAQALAELRVSRHQVRSGNGSCLAISIQSRNEPRAADITDAVLDIRFEGGGDRLPTRTALKDLEASARMLPTLVTISGADAVEIEGGAHLSMAFTVGAALPSTRVSTLRVRQDAATEWWGPISRTPQNEKAGEVTAMRGAGGNLSSGKIAVFVDLVDNPDSDKAFEAFWKENSSLFAERLVLKNTRSWLTPAEGTALTSSVMSIIRKEWGLQGNAILHVFLRVPFPMAVLLGHLSNTLECMIYEWDSMKYVEALQVKSGSGSGTVRMVPRGVNHRL